VIAMQMGEEDHIDAGQTCRPHELALGTLAAINEDALGAPDEENGARSPVHRGSSPGCAEKHKVHIQWDP
jgi:hypothetical protein